MKHQFRNVSVISLAFVLSSLSNASAVTVANYDFSGSFPFTQAFGTGATITDNAGVGVFTNSINGGSIVYSWNGQNPRADQDWILTVDASISENLITLLDNLGGGDTGVGLIAASSSSPTTQFISFDFYAENDGGAAAGHYSDVSPGPDQYRLTPRRSDKLTLSYDADTKIIKALIDGGPTLNEVNVQTAWGMSDSDTFTLGISGYADGGILPTDQNYLWLDNLRLETVPEPSSVLLLGLSCIAGIFRRYR